MAFRTKLGNIRKSPAGGLGTALVTLGFSKYDLSFVIIRCIY